MQIKTLDLSEAMPGMIVAEPIRNPDTGIIYIGENQELSLDILNRLKDTPFTRIKIYVNTWDDVWKISDNTKEEYLLVTSKAKTLLSEVYENHTIDFDKFRTIKDEIHNEFNDNYKVIACVNLLKSASEYTYSHCINVSLLCNLIGKWMKYGKNMQNTLMMAGLMHDIGKMKIDFNILNKPSKLTKDEFDIIKKHPIYSYDLVKDNKELPLEAKIGILMHHERMDGSGYPYGVYAENINDIAKVIAIADVYDAMISERPYQRKHSPFEVMKLMQEGIFGKLDSKILLTFLSNIATYYIGTYVTLNTGEIGEVVAINPSCIYRPIIRVQNEYIDLNKDYTIEIVEEL